MPPRRPRCIRVILFLACYGAPVLAAIGCIGIAIEVRKRDREIHALKQALAAASAMCPPSAPGAP